MIAVLMLASALAQPAMPLSLGAPTVVTPAGSHVLAREVPMARWFDRPELVVSTLPAGTEITLVLTQGELTRVRHGIDFGWVPTDALQAVTVDAAPPTPPTP